MVMNKKILLLALCGTLNLSPAAFGQYFYLIEKQQHFDQTGDSTLVPDSTPFQFLASIGVLGGNNSETDSNPTPPNSVTIPGNPTPYALSNPSSTNNGDWEYKSDFSNLASMDAAFPNGNYTLTTGGSSGNINLTGDLYTNTPVASFSVAGTWSGSVYSIAAGQSLTINTNSIAGFSAGNDHVQIDASPAQGFSGNVSSLQFDSLPNLTDSSGNITIPSIDLQAGETWSIKLEFDAFSSFNSTLIPNGTAIGLYEEKTTFEVTAISIPEPSETVLMAGALALGCAFWRRRHAVTVV